MPEPGQSTSGPPKNEPSGSIAHPPGRLARRRCGRLAHGRSSTCGHDPRCDRQHAAGPLRRCLEEVDRGATVAGVLDREREVVQGQRLCPPVAELAQRLEGCSMPLRRAGVLALPAELRALRVESRGLLPAKVGLELRLARSQLGPQPKQEPGQPGDCMQPPLQRLLASRRPGARQSRRLRQDAEPEPSPARERRGSDEPRRFGCFAAAGQSAAAGTRAAAPARSPGGRVPATVRGEPSPLRRCRRASLRRGREARASQARARRACPQARPTGRAWPGGADWPSRRSARRESAHEPARQTPSPLLQSR